MSSDESTPTGRPNEPGRPAHMHVIILTGVYDRLTYVDGWLPDGAWAFSESIERTGSRVRGRRRGAGR